MKCDVKYVRAIRYNQMTERVEFKKIKVRDPFKRHESFRASYTEETRFAKVVSIYNSAISGIKKTHKKINDCFKNYYVSLILLILVGLICFLFLLDFFEWINSICICYPSFTLCVNHCNTLSKYFTYSPITNLGRWSTRFICKKSFEQFKLWLLNAKTQELFISCNDSNGTEILPHAKYFTKCCFRRFERSDENFL